MLASLGLALLGPAPARGAPGPVEVHVVQSGQTLGGIAKRYRVSIAQLCNTNGIQRTAVLKVGQRLQIPAPPGAKNAELYTVQSGDTLGGIARDHGVKISDITRANRIARNATLRVGQRLRIPMGKSSPARETRAPAKPASDAGMQRLTVPGAYGAFYYEPLGPGRLTLKPVLMYLHGRGGDAAADCQRWAKVARYLGWLVCPIGPEAREGGRGWNNNWTHGRRIVNATLQALRSKFGRRVQLYGNTIIGYSEGALVAMNVGVRDTRAFNRWLILGADTEYWSHDGLRLLSRNRKTIRRVYLITGKRDQVWQRTKEVRERLRGLGVPTRASNPEDMGHKLALESKAAMYRAALVWLGQG